MSSFIEIQDGVFVDASKIEGIRKPDALEGKTIVFTHHRKYSTPLPFETVLAMVSNEESIDRRVSDDQKINATMAKLDQVLNTRQHFAG